MTLKENYLRTHSRTNIDTYARTRHGSSFLFMRRGWLNERLLELKRKKIAGAVSVLLYDTATQTHVRLPDWELHLEEHSIDGDLWLTLHPRFYAPPIFCDCKRREVVNEVLGENGNVNTNVCDDICPRFLISKITLVGDRSLILGSETMCPTTLKSLLYGLPKLVS